LSTKVDLKKELKHLYNPSAKEVSTVDVPAMNFLMVDGEGAPSSPQYMQSIEALFTVSYTLKFMVKKGSGVDYAVMPLEGLWWIQHRTQGRGEIDKHDNAARIRQRSRRENRH